jgi:transposase
MSQTIFLSTVTREFGKLRKRLASFLRRTQRFHRRRQDDFVQRGVVTLRMLLEKERNFAWISRCRRNAMDDERRPEHSEAMIHLAMIALMTKRLALAKS